MNSYSINNRIIFKRRELKYLLSEKAYILLRQRIAVALARDKGCSDNPEGYFIRSLYFDSLGDQALFDKLAGYDPRKKYRIRIYDISDPKGRFEIKAKRGECIHKTSFWIDRDEITAVQVGDYQWMKNKTESHWKMLHNFFTAQVMKPVIIIDYIRDAYTAPFNNLRITFDKNLEITPVDSLKGCSIYDKLLKPYQPMEGKVIMEIKFDGTAIPAHIKKLLSIIDAPRLAISKYAIGRICFSNQPWQTY